MNKPWKFLPALCCLLAAATLAGCAQKTSQEAATTEVATEAVAEAVSGAEMSAAEESDTDSQAGAVESDIANDQAEGASESAAANDQVAGASEMTDVIDVVEEGMVPVPASDLKEGTYDVVMDSSSSMFKADHVKLSVADGKMEAILYMTSKSYLYMFAGTAEEAAAAAEDAYILPEEIEGDMRTFTLPVEALDAGGSYAAFSKKKEKWYDRTLLFRADSLPEEAFLEARYVTAADLGLADGDYTVTVTLEGGSGRASVESPAALHVEDGACTARIVWSSDNYDYMMVDGERYDPVNTEGNSVFEIPVNGFDYEMPVQADTTAMSQPYLIDYTLTFDSAGIKPAESSDSMELSYATQFTVDWQEDGCARIAIGEDAFLLVPEGQEPPKDSDLPVLKQPVTDIYTASSSVLDLFLQADALDSVTMTSTEAANWTIPEIREAVEEDDILYVGKYSAPDYEVVLDSNCRLAIENTMIYHSPETKEQLERLGIPVLVERSSYEPHPLGRVEWIKLYGLLTGHLSEANAFFRESEDRLKQVEEQKPSGKTVAFFYITSSGYANVRKKGDYISRMIELAGGTCLFSDLEDEEGNATSTMNIPLETFYASAVDADILIYNSTVAGDLTSLEDLKKIHPMFADFRAVKNGQVWCTEQNMFQQVSGTAEMIGDLHTVIAGEDAPLTYLHPLS